MTSCMMWSKGAEGLTCSLAGLEVSLLEAALGASNLPHPCQTALCRLSSNAVCCCGGSPSTSTLSKGLGEGLVPWQGMETTARGDLEKLTRGSGSAINHVYADAISGAVAVLCRGPAAGVSIGKGKALWQLPNPAVGQPQAVSARRFAHGGAVGRQSRGVRGEGDVVGSI